MTTETPAADIVEPWGYGWYELGGKKMATGYLPTIDYPRSEYVSDGPFPLYTADEITRLHAENAELQRKLDEALRALETISKAPYQFCAAEVVTANKALNSIRGEA